MKPIQKEEYHIITRKRSTSFNQRDVEDYLDDNEIKIKNGSEEVFFSFSSIPLKDSLRSAIRDEGYKNPTPI